VSNGGYVHSPRTIAGEKVRERGPNDEYAQATLFWHSVSEIEQDHIVDAYTFELGKVEVPWVVERMVARLALVDPSLAERVAFGLGVEVSADPVDPALMSPGADPPGVAASRERDASGGLTSSPALAMVTSNRFPIDGRVVQILANDGCDLNGIRALQAALLEAGAVSHVIATHKGAIRAGGRRQDQLVVDRSFHTASSAEADAVVVAGGTGLATDPAVTTFVQSAFRHFKPIGAWGDGEQLLANAGIEPTAPGVIVAAKATKAFAADLTKAMAVHRHWERAAPHPTLAIERVPAGG
jgi:catalase